VVRQLGDKPSGADFSAAAAPRHVTGTVAGRIPALSQAALRVQGGEAAVQGALGPAGDVLGLGLGSLGMRGRAA